MSKKSSASGPKTMLGVPAVRQIVCKMKKNEKEEMEMAAKLERSCNKLDRANKGALSIEEYWNVCRVQNGIEVSKDEVKAIMIGKLVEISCGLRGHYFLFGIIHI